MRMNEVYSCIMAAEAVTSNLENGGEMENYLRRIKKAVRQGDYDRMVDGLLNLKGTEVEYVMSPVMKFCGM